MQFKVAEHIIFAYLHMQAPTHLLTGKQTIKHSHTHLHTYNTVGASPQLWKQALPEGFRLIDILPHCPGLLQGTSLCSSDDRAHLITAADLK